MSTTASSSYSVATYESTFQLLRALIKEEVDAEKLNINFSQARWVNFHYKLTGFHYHAALDAGIMRSLIEYQNTLYRLAAYIKNDNLNGSAISDELREKLELTFRISDGSSEIKAEWWQVLGTMVTDVTSGMSSKGRLIMVLSLALIVGGGRAVQRCLRARLLRRGRMPPRAARYRSCASVPVGLAFRML